MNDSMDEFLSGIFRGEQLPETQPEFTKAVMQKLPKQQLPNATRTGILLTVLVFSLAIPLVSVDFNELYVWGEELAADSLMTLEYWMDELNELTWV